MTRLHGSCQCGAVEFHVDGDPTLIGHCHCNECRRATGAAFTTYVDCRRDDVSFDAGQPRIYNSSPHVRRTFCGDCGSPIAWESDKDPGTICFFIGVFKEAGSLVPQAGGDTHTHEKLPWLHLRDP